MEKWDLAEVVLSEPADGNIIGKMFNAIAYYRIYSNDKGKQKFDGKAVEGFIKQLLNNGWEPISFTEILLEGGHWNKITWSFKKKIL